ncbi:MAG: hypothetical protein NZ930_01185 [Candidatus Bipolaricaulota bacterium]|nr:hypothetical protein [Candidatus Bipolaricaulota bacterium]MDW8031316.1 hypothetical protein [Candidatus Bipolaricaulota bacterium]
MLALVWAAPGLSRAKRWRLSTLGLIGIALLHWLNLLGQAGMLLAPYGLGKLLAERLFLLGALADMLVPTIVCISLVLRGQLMIRLQEVLS